MTVSSSDLLQGLQILDSQPTCATTATNVAAESYVAGESNTGGIDGGAI